MWILSCAGMFADAPQFWEVWIWKECETQNRVNIERKRVSLYVSIRDRISLFCVCAVSWWTGSRWLHLWPKKHGCRENWPKENASRPIDREKIDGKNTLTEKTIDRKENCQQMYSYLHSCKLACYPQEPPYLLIWATRGNRAMADCDAACCVLNSLWWRSWVLQCVSDVIMLPS